MKRKTIDAAREARLWASQIIVPTATAVVSILAIPKVREAIAVKTRNIKYNVKQKFRKES